MPNAPDTEITDGAEGLIRRILKSKSTRPSQPEPGQPRKLRPQALTLRKGEGAFMSVNSQSLLECDEQPLEYFEPTFSQDRTKFYFARFPVSACQKLGLTAYYQWRDYNHYHAGIAGIAELRDAAEADENDIRCEEALTALALVSVILGYY